METINNFFSNNTFQKTWAKHFIPKQDIIRFKFIQGVNFYKNRFSVFYNIGKNLTKGNLYSFNKNEDYKKKVFVIYDVLPNISTPKTNLPQNLKVLKSRQYPGFLINLDKFKNIDEYLLKTFSKNTRMKMRKFNKRLDECFNISTKMFFGNINSNEYDTIFIDFMRLLEKRYSGKGITNNNMQPAEWNFYKEVAYPLILEKKASLFVVYNNNSPIAITYNYHTKDTLIDAITVFDSDYMKFNLGYINNLKLITWCFNNSIKKLDFSKGFFDYKKRMATLKYDFEYHIIYDKNAIIPKFKAYILFCFFEFKAYLRNKDINTKFHKITHRIKNSKQKENVEVLTLDKAPAPHQLDKIKIKDDKDYSHLNKYINDFLYLSVKAQNEIEICTLKNAHKTYIFQSNSLIQQIKFLD